MLTKACSSGNYNWQHITAGLLILIYPVGIWLVPSGGSSVVNALGLAGLICLVLTRTWSPDRGQSLIALAMLSYLTVTFVSWIVNGQEAQSTRLLNRHLLFLLPILAMFWLARVRPCAGFLWWGVSLSALLLGLVSIYLTSHEVFRTGIKEVTQVNPIVFGQIAAVCTSLAAVSFPYFARLSSKAVIIPAGGLVLGLSAVVGSGTRGAWIALPAVLLLLVFFYRRSLLHHFWKLMVGFVFFSLLFYFVSGWSLVQDRFLEAVTEVRDYVENPENRDTSTGARLDMWNTAIATGMSAPVTGPGKDEYLREIQRRIDAGIYTPESWVALEHFPHSEYFSAFGYHGFSGLTALLLLFGLPGYVFCKRLSLGVEMHEKAVAMGGLILIVCFAVFSLTDSPFEQRPTIMFYSIMLVFFATITPGQFAPRHGKAGTSVDN